MLHLDCLHVERKSIAPDTFSPVREPGSLWFKSYLQSDFGIKKGDRVSYFYQPARTGGPKLTCGLKLTPTDIRVVDNG